MMLTRSPIPTLALAACVLRTLASCVLPDAAAAAQDGGLGPSFQVNSMPAGMTTPGPDVATGPAGQFIVVWSSTNSTGSDSDQESIQARLFTPTGAPIGSQFQVNTTTTDRQLEPQIATNDTGDAVVVWRSGLDIAGQRLDVAGAAVGSEFVVAATSDSEREPAVAVNGGGAFVVAWRATESTYPTPTYRIRARRYDAAGSSIGSAFQVASAQGQYQSVNVPGAAIADDGSSVVVWGEHSLDLSWVSARRYDASGNPIGSEFQVNLATNSCCPSIADDAGGFAVSWIQSDYDPDTKAVRVRRYDAAGVPKGGIKTAAEGSAYHSNADVDVAPSGAFLVVWSVFDPPFGEGGPYQDAILAQRYKANGAANGGNFHVSPYALAGPPGLAPAISFDDANRFVVVWPDDTDPGAGVAFQVLGRRQEVAHLPSLGSFGLVALALLSLAAGVRSIRLRTRRPST